MKNFKFLFRFPNQCTSTYYHAKEGISLRIVYICIFPPLQGRHLAAEIGNYFHSCRPEFYQAKFQVLHEKSTFPSAGFEPGTFHLQGGRATDWATPPIWKLTAKLGTL